MTSKTNKRRHQLIEQIVYVSYLTDESNAWSIIENFELTAIFDRYVYELMSIRDYVRDGNAYYSSYIIRDLKRHIKTRQRNRRNRKPSHQRSNTQHSTPMGAGVVGLTRTNDLGKITQNDMLLFIDCVDYYTKNLLKYPKPTHMPKITNRIVSTTN